MSLAIHHRRPQVSPFSNNNVARANQTANGNEQGNNGNHTINGNNNTLNDNDTNNIDNSRRTVNITKNEYHFHEAPRTEQAHGEKACKGKGKGKGKGKAKDKKAGHSRGPQSASSVQGPQQMMVSMMSQMQSGGMAGGGMPGGGMQNNFGSFRHPGFMA